MTLIIRILRAYWSLVRKPMTEAERAEFQTFGM